MTLTTLPAQVDVAVIGAGFGGIGAAVRLGQAGYDYVVLERGDAVGGTWRDNSYPGCACDVPSHLYSFSFAPNPDWTRSFSPQPEIQDYLVRTAERYRVLDRTALNAEVTGAQWDGAAGRWQVATTRGPVSARYLVSAGGALSEPSIPRLPGLDRFAGTAFHSAEWRHDHDLSGRRVAVVGTGASAIQFVPQVARQAAHLTVFQRTAPWVLPRRDRAVTRAERRLFRSVPAAQRLARAGIYWGRESWIVGFAIRPSVMKLVERRARRWLERQVADPLLRAAVTPRFALGCKRVLLSNDYYPALARPDVSVVTDRIVEVTPAGVVTADTAGERTEHPADTLIFGTGFHVTDQPIANRLRGADGRTLAEHWAGGMSALNGTTVHGFPNLFLLVGPNTGLGHTSIVFMIEQQVEHLIALLRGLSARGHAVLEPRAEAQSRFAADMQRRLAHTVWNAGGCASWYLDAQGRNTTLWPTFTVSFARRLRAAGLADYRTWAAPSPVASATATGGKLDPTPSGAG